MQHKDRLGKRGAAGCVCLHRPTEQVGRGGVYDRQGEMGTERVAWPLSFVHIVRGTVQVGRYHLLQGDVIIRRRALLVGELGGGRCEGGQLSGYCAHH